MLLAAKKLPLKKIRKTIICINNINGWKYKTFFVYKTIAAIVFFPNIVLFATKSNLCFRHVFFCVGNKSIKLLAPNREITKLSQNVIFRLGFLLAEPILTSIDSTAIFLLPPLLLLSYSTYCYMVFQPRALWHFSLFFV